MTFNIRHGRGLDGKVNLQRVAEVIKLGNIDILVLNEVDQTFSKRSHYVDQCKWFADELQLDCLFGPSLSFKGRSYGNAIFTKLPIIKHENHHFRLKPLLAEPRALLEATIQVNDHLVTVLASHFSIHPILHQKQVDFCLQFSTSNPIMLMGDLNRKPGSKSYRLLTTKYLDCCIEQPFPTFPAKMPRSRLDYIFTSKHFDVRRTDVIQTNASDHLPVTAELTFR